MDSFLAHLGLKTLGIVYALTAKLEIDSIVNLLITENWLLITRDRRPSGLISYPHPVPKNSASSTLFDN
jgi:hypothetical protein